MPVGRMAKSEDQNQNLNSFICPANGDISVIIQHTIIIVKQIYNNMLRNRYRLV